MVDNRVSGVQKEEIFLFFVFRDGEIILRGDRPEGFSSDGVSIVISLLVLLQLSKDVRSRRSQWNHLLVALRQRNDGHLDLGYNTDQLVG